ncbi:MAG: exodeoxyribonuclease VII large subunit [Hyphomonadaceae bacterium]|nr:exodeoxyribonuclease VII large subunit [Hyphomonadaceae bacterium]
MSDSASTNAPELSVSELAANLKRTIETSFDRVRVRGELGRVTIARSGHMYCDIKDEKAVLNTVMWKGQVNVLPFRPEEGLEVVAEGKLSIYAGRSNYQLIASSMRPAGAGALMALLEERKKKFAAEGLFDPAHKKALPRFPKTIGVVTSPTGAVIRDILHRVRERFPVRVILWPALVQGDLAAAQIEAGIRGFNAMTGEDRPDVLIVGRGGGSIEDLWPFNEENVVRAAFESAIPLISAVGHETDTTLIDYVSDARAPTPTGAAEIAVPVRSELLLATGEYGERLKRALARRTQTGKDRLRAARLPRAEALVERPRQRLDYAGTALPRATLSLTERARARLDRAAIALPSPLRLVQTARQSLALASSGLGNGLSRAVQAKKLELSRAAGALRPAPLQAETQRARKLLIQTAVRARPALNRILQDRESRLEGHGKLLAALSYQATLSRGFAVVRGADGQVVRASAAAAEEARLNILFADGAVEAIPDGAAPAPRQKAPSAAKPKAPAKSSKPKSPSKDDQGSLF